MVHDDLALNRPMFLDAFFHIVVDSHGVDLLVGESVDPGLLHLGEDEVDASLDGLVGIVQLVGEEMVALGHLVQIPFDGILECFRGFHACMNLEGSLRNVYPLRVMCVA